MTLPDDLDLPASFATVVDPSAEPFRRLVAVVAKLRSPDGCPWDKEQTHHTLARHLLEETYEVLEAIAEEDQDGLREELGDLMLQVVLHAQLASESGDFTIADVTSDLTDKLVRRHPHVFGEVEVTGAEQVLANWEASKRAEKGMRVLEGIPKAMPALARASKMSRRAAQVGFDWSTLGDAAAKVAEELDEVASELDGGSSERLEAEIGDLLFAVAVLSRKAGIEPETALRRATQTFQERFEVMESRAITEGRDLESLSADEWSRYWESATQEEGPR